MFDPQTGEAQLSSFRYRNLSGPLVGIAILAYGLWPWHGTSTPTRLENALASRALHVAVAARRVRRNASRRSENLSN
jgi:hypothetical protein